MNMWNNRSDEYFSDIQNGLDIIFDKAERAFPPVVWKMIKREFQDLQGKRVLVPSSGDNIAVFGFHLLGAIVTSCDFAERQLFNAKKIADANGWNIKFIRQNSMELEAIGDKEYDLVYTSNGVHVWIYDLPKMYTNFYRVLKPGGRYIMFETHPFIRPFDDSGVEVIIDKAYEDTGPFVSGEYTEFAWRIMDIFNAICGAGLTVTRMEEFHPQKGEWDDWFYDSIAEAEADNYKKHDWKQNPWAALPQWIGFTARKDGR
jgi:SAM-dependent methyltransferase